MPMKSRSRTIIRKQNWLGSTIHPGEMLLEEYLKPLRVGQVEAARQLGVSLNRLNEIVLGRAVRQIFSPSARPAQSGAPPRVSGIPAARPQTRAGDGEAPRLSAPVLLREDADAAVPARRHPVSEGVASSGNRLELMKGDQSGTLTLATRSLIFRLAATRVRSAFAQTCVAWHE